MPATLTINKLDETDAAQLYHRYEGQSDPNSCYLEIDLEDGQMTCDTRTEIGNAVPEGVYHHRQLRYDIPVLTAQEANRLLDAARPYAERVIAGAEVAWNGNNFTGRLNEDAGVASEALENLIASDFPDDPELTVGEWEADDWFTGSIDEASELGITDATTDEQLKVIAVRAEKEVVNHTDRVVVTTGFLEYVIGLRDDKRSEVRDQLEEAAEKMETGRSERDDLVRRVRGWNVDSLREIGALAGLSHTQVDNVVAKGKAEQ